MAKTKFNYREALAEVKTIIEELNGAEADIDILSEKVARATQLLLECKKKLRHTEEEMAGMLNALDED